MKTDGAQITYVDGDASRPDVTPGAINVIVHVCNDVGGWGAGFVLALSREHPEVERAYRAWAQEGEHQYATGPFRLGEYQIAPTQKSGDLYVCNLIGQVAPGSRKQAPVRYEAIRTALRRLAGVLATSERPAYIHAPRFGSGLAGGKWETIEQIIEDEVIAQGIPVTIYDYQPEPQPDRSEYWK